MSHACDLPIQPSIHSHPLAPFKLVAVCAGQAYLCCNLRLEVGRRLVRIRVFDRFHAGGNQIESVRATRGTAEITRAVKTGEDTFLLTIWKNNATFKKAICTSELRSLIREELIFSSYLQKTGIVGR